MKSSNACLKSAATSAHCSTAHVLLEVDHIIHKGGGGTEGSFNLTIAYRKCNDKKAIGRQGSSHISIGRFAT